MSGIDRVPVEMWRNPDMVNRVYAGTVPIGDYEVQDAPERHSFESFVDDAEEYVFWGSEREGVSVVEEPVVPAPKKRGRPKKQSVKAG